LGWWSHDGPPEGEHYRDHVKAALWGYNESHSGSVRL
jgi:hypothetical protein